MTSTTATADGGERNGLTAAGLNLVAVPWYLVYTINDYAIPTHRCELQRRIWGRVIRNAEFEAPPQEHELGHAYHRSFFIEDQYQEEEFDDICPPRRVCV